jgi:hypothetical protein
MNSSETRQSASDRWTRKIGRSRLRRLEDVPDDLRKMKVKGNGEEWRQIVQEAKAQPEL